MSAQNKIAILLAATVLTACATAQENPHYQHSSKYTGEAPNTVYAENIAADTRQVVYIQSPEAQNLTTANYATTTYAAPSYSRVNAACVAQGLQNTAGCAPAPMAINSQSAAVASPYAGNPQTFYVTNTTTTSAATSGVSPTDTLMPDSYGTPGYEAMRNAQTPQWETVQSVPAPGVAVPMTQPFASPLPAPAVRQAMSADMMPRAEQNFTLGTQHEIMQGDTVYSFARSLCSSVEEIKAINGLDGNFSIRLGDTIRLPASKC